MKLPITAHEYQINGGTWTGCTASNTTDNGDGTYTIHDGLNVGIPIGDLKVRVKALRTNPASTALQNTVAFNAPSSPRAFQIFFIGDSLTAGVGTTGTGNSASAQYNGPNSYPVKTMSMLTGLDAEAVIRPFPGRRVDEYSAFDLQTTISLFDKEHYTDIYCVLFWGANDIIISDESTFEANYTPVMGALQAAGAKVIVVPVLSSKGSYAAAISYANIARRNSFNTWLSTNFATYCDAIVDLSGYPEIFADDAPDNATYFGSPDPDGNTKTHLTDAGAELLATAISASIISLSTTTSIPITPVDYAADFIDSAGITDSGQIAAINALVDDLISSKIWWRFSAIYPFVGGTAAAHKLNLRDPRDLNAAKRLTFNGTPTHDANGITWTSGAYADTNFGQSQNNFLVVNTSLHYYSRNTPGTPGIDMGYYASASYWLGIKFSGNSYTTINDADGSGVSESYTDIGLFTTSRANNPVSRGFFRNGSLLRNTTSAFNSGVPSGNVYLGAAQNIAGGGGMSLLPSDRNCAYAAIGYGLTDSEEAAHYTIIQAFQTTLGRAV
jgi:lysophospholipase L1-like esterase